MIITLSLPPSFPFSPFIPLNESSQVFHEHIIDNVVHRIRITAGTSSGAHSAPVRRSRDAVPSTSRWSLHHPPADATGAHAGAGIDARVVLVLALVNCQC